MHVLQKHGLMLLKSFVGTIVLLTVQFIIDRVGLQ